MQSSNTLKKIIILGIDPGYADCGFGIITKEGSKLSFHTADTIKSPASQPFAERLNNIYTELTELIKKYKPNLVAVESLFFFKNKKTAINVAHARGVILLAAAQMKIPLVEYTPPQIKQSLTSHGQATKQQVGLMIKTILNIKTLPKNDDAVDAIAVAVCAAFREKNI